MNYKNLLIVLLFIPALSFCEAGLKQISQESLQDYFSNNRVGSSPDYAIMKNGNDHLMAVHGYGDDLGVCLELIEPYNNDPSLSAFSGSYSCVPLNSN
jgi:hypothetical protein